MKLTDLTAEDVQNFNRFVTGDPYKAIRDFILSNLSVPSVDKPIEQVALHGKFNDGVRQAFESLEGFLASREQAAPLTTRHLNYGTK